MKRADFPGRSGPPEVLRTSAALTRSGSHRASLVGVLACVAGVLVGCRVSSDPAVPAPMLAFSQSAAWPERAVAAPPVGGRLIVTNNLDDTLSVFDAAKVGEGVLPELERRPIGVNPIEIEAPHHAALAPAGDFLYVALANTAPGVSSGPHGAHGNADVDGTVLKLRARDYRVVGSARVDRNPGDLTVSADGTRLAVSHFDLLRVTEAARGEVKEPDARLVVIDTATMEVTARVRTCPAPHGVLFAKDGKRLYAACYSDEVAVVDLSTAEPTVTRVKVASNAGDAFGAIYQPYALAESPLTGDLFVSCPAQGQVRVLKTDTLTIDATRTATLGGSPFLSAFSADGQTLWVPTQGDDRISDVDPATGFRRRVLTPSKGSCTTIHSVLPVGAHLAVVCEGNHVTAGSLVVLDAATGATVSVTPVGVFPDFVGFLRTPP